MSIDLIIERIKSRMEALGTTARATSIRAGLPPNAIGKVIRRRNVTYNTLEKVANALDCSVAHLISKAAKNPESRSFASMPKTLQEKQPVEFDGTAFDRASRATEYWIEQRGGSVSTYEYSKLLWRFYVHAFRKENARSKPAVPEGS